ncbi:MAG: tetratricopeptide repeat-containing diguanylate cyclase [Roseburia sp.]
MLQKYYKSILDQVYKKIGQTGHNVALAKYSNDFSIRDKVFEKKGHGYENATLFTYEFHRGRMSGAYEPFMSIIKEILQNSYDGTLDELLEKCDVYKPQRQIFTTYFESGKCRRIEPLLYNETQYEQERMQDAVLRMLIELSRTTPFLLLINRIQLASFSTISFLKSLVTAEDTENIGVVLGMNKLWRSPEYMNPAWDELLEELEERNCVFNIGNAGLEEQEDAVPVRTQSLDEELLGLRNDMFLLDFEQAIYGLEQINRRIKFDNQNVSSKDRFELWYLYAFVSIYTSDLPKALEFSEDIRQLDAEELRKSGEYRDPEYYYYYISATTYMYQNKLEEAIARAKKAQEVGKDDERCLFEAELLETKARMAGWNNVFFCVQDVEISKSLIEKLIKYKYFNHLSYIYIYAYDNKPETVAKAYVSEGQLLYFSKGIKLAKETGNERLLFNAYQKNIMLAVANGMYQIGMLYTVRTFEIISEKQLTVEGGRAFSAIGYDLSAMGKNEMAIQYFAKAIQIFYNLNVPDDIAEAYYNMALNYIDMDRFQEANECLSSCMHIVEKLHLNSLRVCNLSKLYALQALCNQMLGNYFNCEQYLNNCKQFLNYVIEKEKVQNETGIIHDYASCDDDIFLYYFATALKDLAEEKDAEANQNLDTAERHLLQAEGNQYYCYRLFRTCRAHLYEKLGNHELQKDEEALLEQHEANRRSMSANDELKILIPMEEYLKEHPSKDISESEVETLIHHESIRRAYLREKRQMEFMSTWQKLLDLSNVTSAEKMMDDVMRAFMYQFNLDCSIYIRYRNRLPQVLYDNTDVELSEETLEFLRKTFEKRQKGFSVSKISANYSENLSVIKCFGEDHICSMAAIPFFDNGRVTSIVIAYIRMKDNWHSSVNRYMLDESDLNMYELLFREVQYSLNRLDAYERIYEMNQLLYKSAVTDQLTGVSNRKGFYEQVAVLIDEVRAGKREKKFAIMFIDLDNFKGYNDTYGHDVGDLLLVSMAHIFDRVALDNGFVVRWGGDEFLILAHTDDRDSLEAYAKQIYQEIQDHDSFTEAIENAIGEKVTIEDEKKLSCSIGIVASDQVEQEDDINSMIMQADDLMYDVKKHSKGTYKFVE